MHCFHPEAEKHFILSKGPFRREIDPWTMSRVCYGNQPFPFFPLTGFHFSLAEREKTGRKKVFESITLVFPFGFFFSSDLVYLACTYEDRKNHPQTGSPLFSLCVHFQLKNPFGESMTHIFLWRRRVL